MAEHHIEIIHAYRHLYRALLRAVHFSTPARYTILLQLRTGFRAKGAKFDARAIERTISFVQAATRARGVEHKVLRNLLTVAWWRNCEKFNAWKHVKLAQDTAKPKHEFQQYVQNTAYKHHDMTVAMLNKSMGLCLR